MLCWRKRLRRIVFYFTGGRVIVSTVLVCVSGRADGLWIRISVAGTGEQGSIECRSEGQDFCISSGMSESYLTRASWVQLLLFCFCCTHSTMLAVLTTLTTEDSRSMLMSALIPSLHRLLKDALSIWCGWLSKGRARFFATACAHLALQGSVWN